MTRQDKAVETGKMTATTNQDPAVIRGYAWRAVTVEEAKWIGMAAVVAGGYVAVGGPRVAIAPRSRYERLIEQHAEAAASSGAFKKYNMAAYETALALWHRLPCGRAATISGPDDIPDAEVYGLPFEMYHVMAVSPHAGLARRGIPLSEELVEELVPELEEYGYATTYKEG